MEDADDILAEAAMELELAEAAVRESIRILRAARKSAGLCIACGKSKDTTDAPFARCRSCRRTNGKHRLRQSA